MSSSTAAYFLRPSVRLPAMGADGYDGTPDYVVKGADLSAFNDVYWTNHYDPADTSEKVQSFVKAYQAKYNATPNAISALAYDAVYMAWSHKDVLRHIREEDQRRAAYYRYYTGEEWRDAGAYDLSLDSSKLGEEGCVEMICKALPLFVH